MAVSQNPTWEFRKGVEGRICKVCGVWKPRPKMWNRRGRICNTCAAKMPRFKYRSTKARAVKAGIPFDLSFEDFMRHWQESCAYCGSTIETIGLDRVDNDLGYEPNNVVGCCSYCNAFKSNGTVEEFVERCRKISHRHP